MKVQKVFLCAALAVPACGAQAQFDTLERFGGLRVEGYIEFQDYDFSRSRVQNDGMGFHLAQIGPLVYTLDLPPLALSSTVMSATGAAHAEQASQLDDTTLSYSAKATAGMDGTAAIGALFGSALGRSNFQATFNVASDSTALLHMNSASDVPGGIYTFSLVRNDGTLIWNQTSVAGAGGSTLHDFTTSFGLAPGSYELNTALVAQAGLDPTIDHSVMEVTAAFELSVSAVPEPSETMLLLAGLAALGRVVKRRRQSL
jgi:hypothetical protein